MWRFSLFQKAALFLLLLVIYSPSINGPYIFDDSHTIEANPQIQSTSNWMATLTSGKAYSTLPMNYGYRPVITFTTMLLWSIGGGATWPFHLFKIFIFFGLCLTLFKIWKVLLPSFKDEVLLAGIFIFAANPVHTQVLGYISATSTLLTGFFVCLALWWYLQYRESQSKKQLFVSFLFAFLAPLTKEEGVVILAFIPLTEFYLRKIEGKKILVWKWEMAFYLIPVGIALALLYGRFEPTSQIARGGIPRLAYFMTQWRAYLRYIAMYFVPYDLNADNLEFGFSFDITEPVVLFALVGNVLVLAIAFFSFKKLPQLTLALLMFYSGISPASSIIPLAEPVNDHRAFVGYLGFSIASLVLLDWIYRSKNRAFKPFSVAVLLVYCIGCFQRSTVWGDNEPLWVDTVKKNPTSARALNNLAHVYMIQNKSHEALELLDRCVNLGVNYSYCFLNRAVVLAGLGNDQKAESDFEAAVRVDIGKREAKLHYAKFLLGRGRLSSAIPLLKDVDEVTQGSDLAVRLELIEATRRSGDQEAAKSLFLETRATFGDHPWLLNFGRTSGLLQ